MLVGCGFAIGRHGQAPVALNDVISKPILNKEAWVTAYNAYTAPLSATGVLTANNEIMASTCSTSTPIAVQELCTWYKAESTNAIIKGHCQAAMTSQLQTAATPSAAAAPAKADPAPTGSSISSYSEFGHLYSHETAGKPWPEIMQVDEWVRETLHQTALVAVKKLSHWYHYHATPEQRKDFDDNAVAHMKLGATR